MPKIATLNSVYPTDCATLLSIRKQYTACRYDLNRGYIAYQIQLPSRHYEHRLVADIVFDGIPEGYHVHHINKVITDNRATNLRLLNPSEHAKQHNPPLGKMLSCPVCNTLFWVSPSIQRRRNVNYCRPECTSISQRVTERPAKDELITLLSETPNFMAISKLFGVSDNAIRKWCRFYDLPTKTGEWKKGRLMGHDPTTSWATTRHSAN